MGFLNKKTKTMSRPSLKTVNNNQTVNRSPGLPKSLSSSVGSSSITNLQSQK